MIDINRHFNIVNIWDPNMYMAFSNLYLQWPDDDRRSKHVDALNK
jgi:hypothetical protein